MTNNDRRFRCPPPCGSTNLTPVEKDDFEHRAKRHCNKCGKEFYTNSLEDTADYSFNQ